MQSILLKVKKMLFSKQNFPFFFEQAKFSLLNKCSFGHIQTHSLFFLKKKTKMIYINTNGVVFCTRCTQGNTAQRVQSEMPISLRHLEHQKLNKSKHFNYLILKKIKNNLGNPLHNPTQLKNQQVYPNRSNYITSGYFTSP